MQNWSFENKYQFRGLAKRRGNTSFLYFDLDEPKVILPRSSSDSGGKVVSENDYPNTEQNQFSGSLSFALRLNRDQIISQISEEDLLDHGTMMANPLIGVIPSREEIEEELQQLLMSM